MIPNGATLQMGLGSIPDAVLNNLRQHKDLGIHTELFSDGVIDLVEAGVITGAVKTFHPGKIVAGFLFGSQRLYRLVRNNPLIELHSTDYVNDPYNIAQNDKMVAINSALQVDLTGQVCADSMGPCLYSGAGGRSILSGALPARKVVCPSSLSSPRLDMTQSAVSSPCSIKARVSSPPAMTCITW